MQKSLFSLEKKAIVITGGAGLLGSKHAEAVASVGGRPILLDRDGTKLDHVVAELGKRYSCDPIGLVCDITDKNQIISCMDRILDLAGEFHGLINNAANNPIVDSNLNKDSLTRFENISADFWSSDISVGLTGAFFCCQVFGAYMAANAGGVIVNVSSDLSVISPDQRIYRTGGGNEQPVKPVTYSVVKTGLIGLTRYLATYWADNGVRVNAISPGGVYVDQPDDFVERLSALIPMGRMAVTDEYKGTIIYLLSDASSYMTGFNLVVDGGRSCW